MPTKRMGLLNSDAAIHRAYQGQYDAMTVKYALVTESRPTLWRRLLRWVCRLFS